MPGIFLDGRGLPRLRPLPVRVVFQREQRLNRLGSAARFLEQQLNCPANSLHSGIIRDRVCPRAAVDSIEDRCNVQQLASCFEKICIQSFAGGEWRHVSHNHTEDKDKAHWRL